MSKNLKKEKKRKNFGKVKEFNKGDINEEINIYTDGWQFIC